MIYFLLRSNSLEYRHNIALHHNLVMWSIHHSFGFQTSEWMNLVQSLPMLFIQVACSGFWNPADVALERHTNTVSTQHGECATNSTRRRLPVTSCYCHVGNNTDEQSALTHCHDTQFTFWTSVSQSCTIRLIWVLELKTGSWPATQRNTFKAHEFMYVLDGFLYSFHHWKSEMNSRIMHIWSDLLYIYDLFSGGFLHACAYRDTVDVYKDE